MFKLAIFASGNGTNAQHLLSEFQNDPRVKIELIVTDRASAYVIERAKKFDCPVAIIEKKTNKKDHEENIKKVLEKYCPDLICLAGYMRLLSGDFLRDYPRVINIHPSLLPDYPGLNSYARAFNDNITESGVTVHWVDSGMDTGEVILQERFERLVSDDLRSFEDRGRELEYKLYPAAIKKVIEQLGS